MTKEVQLHDGTILEFPDDTSDEVIDKAVKSHLGLEKQPDNVGGSVFDPLGQGAFFGLSDELAGIVGATFGALDPNMEGTTFGERYRGIRDSARMNLDAFRARNPVGSAVAEIGGGLTTGGIGAAKAGAFRAARSAPTFLGRVAPAVQTGAVQGGIYGFGASEAEDAAGLAMDAAKGSAIGATTAAVLPAIGAGINSAARRVFDTIDTSAFNKAKDLLRRRAGLNDLTTGQATGSQKLRSTESTLSDSIFGGAIGRQLRDNRLKLQRALMREAGFPMGAGHGPTTVGTDDINSGLITADAIDEAADWFSTRYENLLRGRQIDMGTQNFVDDLADIQARHSNFLPFQQKKQVSEIINQIFDDATTGPTTATRYNKIRSDLAKLERDSALSNPTLSSLYRDIKHAIDDEVADQLKFQFKKKELDLQYSRFATLRDTHNSLGGVEAVRGEMPLASLLRNARNRRRGTDRSFQELVAAGQAVLGDATSNSGTAGRALSLGAPIASASLAGTTPVGAAVAIGGPIAASNLLSRGVTGQSATQALINAGIAQTPVVQGLLNQ